MKLICLPYAGGSATSIYSRWHSWLPPGCTMVYADLPGRGRLIKEEPLEDIDSAVRYFVTGALAPVLASGEPYILWGHSMGGMVAYETTRYLQAHHLRSPKHLILSGNRPMHLRKKKDPIHDLPKVEFIEEIKTLGGTPKDFFNHPELVDLFLPVLRSDFKLVYNYTHKPVLGRVQCPVTVLYGSKEDRDDHESPLDQLMNNWHVLTEMPAQILELEGDHFFLFDHEAFIGNLLREKCNDLST